MYDLDDPHAEAILATDAARGVTVRVVLDGHDERGSNTAAYQDLRAHGVTVHWAPPKFCASHEKVMLVDRHLATIMTGNLTSRYYPNTRDFAVVDTVAVDVAALDQAFDADFDGVGGVGARWRVAGVESRVAGPLVMFIESARGECGG